MILNEKQDAYIKEGLEYGRVTKIIQDVGILDARWFDEYAAIRGTYVHTATDLWDKKDLDMESLDPKLLGYLNGWIKFRNDNPDIIIVESEKLMYSDMMRVAGRLDNLCTKNGIPGIIDKKAATSLNPAVEIQTAGYESMYREMTGYKGKMWRKAVQLFPDGTYKAKNLTDNNDLGVWHSAVNVFNWKRKRR